VTVRALATLPNYKSPVGVFTAFLGAWISKLGRFGSVCPAPCALRWLLRCVRAARLAPRAVIALLDLFASLLGARVTLRQAGRGLLAHKMFARSLAPELTLGYLLWPCRHLFELLHDLVVRVKTLVLACWVECGVVPNFGLFAQAALH